MLELNRAGTPPWRAVRQLQRFCDVIQKTNLHRKRDFALSTTPQLISPAHRVAWGILIVSTLYVCYFRNLDVIGLVGPDEPRYAWIARDMAESGDWITPRLYGRPWFEKPPLLYWGGAIFFKLMPDRPEVAGRLPSAISALLATLALAWLAWRTYGEQCARWLLLLLPTSVGMIGFSHACATDMPFASMLTVALVCAAVMLGLVPASEDTPILPRTPWAAILLFGFFLGLAVLAKGPAALLLTGGAVFFWALFNKRWSDAFRLFHPVSIAVFLLTALPWYILCARRNPDFFRIFIIEHNFKRYFTPEFQHIQPFWFYGPILLIAFLPWITILVWSAVSRIRKRPSKPLTLFLISWSAFCIVFFSISQSKLPGYILPAIPAIGLLLARAVQSRHPSQTTTLRIFAAAGSLLFALSAFFFFKLNKQSYLNDKSGEAYALLSLCFAAVNLFLFFVKQNTAKTEVLPVSMLTAVPLLVALCFAPFFVTSSFAYDPSGKTLADEIERPTVRATNVYAGPMNRGKRYSLNFYLNEEISDWDPAHPNVGLLVLQRQNCQELVPAPYSCTSSDWLEGAGAYLYSVTLPDSLGGADGRRQPK